MSWFIDGLWITFVVIQFATLWVDLESAASLGEGGTDGLV